MNLKIFLGCATGFISLSHVLLNCFCFFIYLFEAGIANTISSSICEKWLNL